jgi:hypothetical protein
MGKFYIVVKREKSSLPELWKKELGFAKTVRKFVRRK